MEDLELFYLRDLAFEYLPRDKKNLIESNLKLAARTRASSEEVYSSAAVSMMLQESGLLKAVETAAVRLLFLVSSHPLLREDGSPERGVKEFYDERRDLIICAAYDLAKIAEISLPVWLSKKHNPDVEALRKEVDSLRAEMERLKAENAELKAEDEINPRKEDTYLHMIAAMAIKLGHDFSISKNGTNKEIRDKLFEIHGKVVSSESAIRNGLNSAKETLPVSLTKPKSK